MRLQAGDKPGLADQLADLARAGFVDLPDALGPSLRQEFDRMPGPKRLRKIASELAGWRAELNDFENRDHAARAALLARGVRLLRGAPAPAALSSPCTQVRGIGPAFAAALAEKGIATLADLLLLMPRRYDDARTARKLATLGDATAAAEGERICVTGTIASARMVFARGRRWLEVRVVDDGVQAVIRFFGFRGGTMPAQTPLCWVGKPVRRGAVWEFANPDVLRGPGIIVHYPEVAGIPPGRLRAACAAACEQFADTIDDGLSSELADEFGLWPLPRALRTVHLPASDAGLDLQALQAGRTEAHRRIAFGELFALSLIIAARKRDRQSRMAPICAAEASPSVPFALTGAQLRVMAEIQNDMAGSQPMSRLLQGDVGAGKTAVIYAAALRAARSGCQAAVMAPTELLAEQHLRTMSVWAERDGVRMARLSAGLPAPAKRTLLARLAAGEMQIVVGTHALLADAVAFARLGLVVIDEQHRFGVAQRVRLREQGAREVPHLLVATATPIPRTLALTAYGDLELSRLDELPPGRQPATTHAVHSPAARARVYEVLAERAALGQRAYVVCARIDDSGVSARRDVERLAAEIAARVNPAWVAVMHSRVPMEQRDQIMRDFHSGDIRILVATTLVEVGVDVPTATVMIVEDADVFGLAQLHQLRGRVGRGGGSALCFLISQQASSEARERLATVARTTDGLAIAEADLELRGAGDLLGDRQAGVPRVRYGSLNDHLALLQLARAAAERTIMAGSRADQHAENKRVLGSDGG